MADPKFRANECFLCKQTGHLRGFFPQAKETTAVECPSCGTYTITDEAARELNNRGLTDVDRARLCGAVREAYERDRKQVLIQLDNIDPYLANAPHHLDLPVKARKFLSALARHSRILGQWIELKADVDFPLAYAVDAKDLSFVAKYASKLRWVERSSTGFRFQLAPEGWEEVRRRPRIESPIGFVAMWFSDETTEAYDEAFKPAIEDDCRYESRRIDRVHFLGGIVDKIMAEINEARFVVCDLTGQRQSVYFEAGYAMGLDVPVIWTCRDNWADKTAFDAKHLNQIRWKEHGELREAVATRIQAVIGMGPIQHVQ